MNPPAPPRITSSTPTNGQVDDEQYETGKTDGEQQFDGEQPFNGPANGRAGAGELLLELGDTTCRGPTSHQVAEPLEPRLGDPVGRTLPQLTYAQIVDRSRVPEIERRRSLTRDEPPDQQGRPDNSNGAGNDNEVHQISALIMERIQIHPTPSSMQAPNRICGPGEVRNGSK